MENNTSLQQQLLEAGVHFGHLRKKWNPKMLPYIFAEKKGIHIIDLNKTTECLQETAAVLKQIARSGKKILCGIAQLSRVPAALFIVDIGHEHIALAEAKRLGVGTFGVVDTNCDPNKVDFAIPANDDATKSIAIITQYITAAIAEGLAERQAAKDEETDDSSLSDENQKKAARMEAEAQAEAGGGGKPRGGGQPRRRTPSSPKRTSNR